LTIVDWARSITNQESSIINPISNQRSLNQQCFIEPNQTERPRAEPLLE
jgi:hypothetical protein